MTIAWSYEIHYGKLQIPFVRIAFHLEAETLASFETIDNISIALKPPSLTANPVTAYESEEPKFDMLTAIIQKSIQIFGSNCFSRIDPKRSRKSFGYTTFLEGQKRNFE